MTSYGAPETAEARRTMGARTEEGCMLTGDLGDNNVSHDGQYWFYQDLPGKPGGV